MAFAGDTVDEAVFEGHAARPPAFEVALPGLGFVETAEGGAGAGLAEGAQALKGFGVRGLPVEAGLQTRPRRPASRLDEGALGPLTGVQLCDGGAQALDVLGPGEEMEGLLNRVPVNGAGVHDGFGLPAGQVGGRAVGHEGPPLWP